jgi:hypothetical protein
MEPKEHRILRGAMRAMDANTKRQADRARAESKRPDPQATVITDIKTVIGYATLRNPDQVVSDYLKR